MQHFIKLGLNDTLIKAVQEIGFEVPTPVQEEVIPAILQSESNIIALAQTGTGKTAAFGLPLLQKSTFASNSPEGLILCPTRELCVQIHKDLTNYAKYMPAVRTVAVYGGADIVRQMNRLKDGVNIVVGTPGRVLDLIGRKVLKGDELKWLVLDEADEMLNMGFQEELDNILASTPKEKRTLLFSATMPDGIRKIAAKYIEKPVEITLGGKNIGAENVTHQYYMVQAKDRYLALKRIADIHPGIYSIVFCRTRQEAREIAEKLIQDGYNADALHGDLSQAQRDHVMNRFRNKALQMLVATDVAARGLDVSDLTHVINYNLPDDIEAYIHRSGRTGRAGKQGVSISIIHSRETRKISDLEKTLEKRFTRKMVPTGKEICEKQLFHLIDKMEHSVVDEEQIGKYIDVIYKKLEWLSKEELIKKFVSLEFNRFLEYYRNAVDINIRAKTSEKSESGKSRRSSNDRIEKGDNTIYTNLFINIGSKQNLTPARLIGLIKDYGRGRRVAIGKIDIQRNFSFFEIESTAVNKVIGGLKGVNFEGVSLEANFTVSKQQQTEKKQKQSGGSKQSKGTEKPQKKRVAKKEREVEEPFWKTLMENEEKKRHKRKK